MKHAVNLPLEDEQAVDLIRWLAACPQWGTAQTR